MDHLQNIISTLDESERREFRQFIQRTKRKLDRKDLSVFDCYCSLGRKFKSTEVKELGFPSSNAYHSTRKRLYAHLSDYAVLKYQTEDSSDKSRVSGLTQIARHLFDRGLVDLAWTSMAKAEELAQKKGLFAELNTIYLLQAEHALSRPDFDMAELARRQKENRRQVEAEESLLMKRAEVEHRIGQARRMGREVDLISIFQSVTRGGGDRLDVSNSPRALFLILQSMRRAIIRSKEYAVFSNMAKSLYQGLSNRHHHLYNAEILYMIAHSEYRNKQFSEATEAIDSLEKELALCSKLDQKRLGSKLKVLKAANGLLHGKLKEAIHVLDEMLPAIKDSRLKSNVTLNLAVYHFYSNQYKSALQQLASLRHSDKWYEERMGLEWCFKHRLIELLTIHELGDVDLFESRMRSIQRRFAVLLRRPQYAKAKAFLSLVKKYDRHFDNLDMDKLQSEIEVSWEWLPKEQEDLQAMMFYSWLRAKVVGKECYAVLLEMVGGTASEKRWSGR